MGFPYGDGLYGKGLYSRRPDWWRAKDCTAKTWAEQTCGVPVWTVTDPPGSAWAPKVNKLPIAGARNGR